MFVVLHNPVTDAGGQPEVKSIFVRMMRIGTCLLIWAASSGPASALAPWDTTTASGRTGPGLPRIILVCFLYFLRGDGRHTDVRNPYQNIELR